MNSTTINSKVLKGPKYNPVLGNIIIASVILLAEIAMAILSLSAVVMVLQILRAIRFVVIKCRVRRQIRQLEENRVQNHLVQRNVAEDWAILPSIVIHPPSDAGSEIEETFL